MNALHEENVSAKRPHNVTYEALSALQGVAFAVPTLIKGCSVNDLPTTWKATFRELSEDKFTWSFHYLGERQFTCEEVGMMQAFHMSILNLQVPELPVQQQDKYGFYPCDKSFWGHYFEQITEGDDVMATMPYVQPEEWSRSSNGAWYVIAPVHATENTIVCQNQDAESEKRDPWLTISELFQTAASAMAWINNLNVVHNILSSPNGQTVDIVSDHGVEDKQHLGDYIFTSNGRNIIRLDPISPCATSLLDIMDSKTNTSYATYFQKRGPLSQEFITSLLSENTNSTDEGKEAKKKMVHMETISSKLTFWNLIARANDSQETSTKNAKRRKSSTSQTRSQSTLPSLCWKLGYLSHYYQSMLLPSVTYRFQSLSLASELRSLIQTRWLPVRMSRKMLIASDSNQTENNGSGRNIDSAKSSDTTTDEVTLPQVDSVASPDAFPDDMSLLPPLTSILEAMTSSRAHETLVSERLEFLGDAFLKMAATLEAYVIYPDASEGELSTRCKYVICNRTLSKLATSQDVAKYLRVFPLSRGLEEVYLRPPGLANETQPSHEDTMDTVAAASETLATKMDNDDALEEGEIQETEQSPDRMTSDTKESSNRPFRWLPCLRNANLHMPRASISNSNVVKQATESITEATTDTPVEPTDEELIRQAFQPEHIPCKQCQLAIHLPRKVLADIMEALLGACVIQTPLSQGLEAASMMAQSVKILKHDYVYRLAHATLEDRFKIFHFPAEQSLNAVLIPHPNQLEYSEELDLSRAMDVDTEIPNESSTLHPHQEQQQQQHQPVNEDTFASTTTKTAAEVAVEAVEETSKTTTEDRDTAVDDHRQDMDDVLLWSNTVVTDLPLPTSSNSLPSFRRHALPLATSTLQQLQAALQYTFHCPSLLGVAFTHASMSFEFLSYDRLEFLGDAVLDFIVAKRLFDMHPTWEEGHLSESKHAHTNNKYLSTLGAKLQVLRFVRHNSSAILRILPTLYGEDEDQGTIIVEDENEDEDEDGDGEEDTVQDDDRGEICEDQETSAVIDDEVTLPRPSSSSSFYPAVDQDTIEDTQKAVTNPQLKEDIEATKTHKTYNKTHNTAKNKTTKVRKDKDDHGRPVEVPESIVKIQADIVEAIVGAVYLDCGGDLTQVTQMLTHLGLFADSMSIKPVFVSTPATSASAITTTTTTAAASNKRRDTCDTCLSPSGKKSTKTTDKPNPQQEGKMNKATTADSGPVVPTTALPVSAAAEDTTSRDTNNNSENETPQTCSNSHSQKEATLSSDILTREDGHQVEEASSVSSSHLSKRPINPISEVLETLGHKRPHDECVEEEDASKRPKLDLYQ